MDPTNVERLDSWRANWREITVVVVGLGESGFAIADTLAELGSATTVVHCGIDDDRSRILDVIGVSVVSVATDEDVVSTITRMRPDLVVISPDWCPELAIEQPLWASGVTVWSDVEFATRVADKHGQSPDIVLFAGSPRSVLVADTTQRFLLAGGRLAARAGQGAPSVLDALRHPDGVDVVLWTLTTRQLWRMGLDESTRRRPRVSVYVPGDTDELEAIQALYTNTLESCFYQPSTQSETALERASVIEGARAIGFTAGTPGMSDIGRVDEVICDRAFLPDRKDRALELCTLDELAQAGFRDPDTVEAAIAACGVARALDVAPEVIGGALQSGDWPDPVIG